MNRARPLARFDQNQFMFMIEVNVANDLSQERVVDYRLLHKLLLLAVGTLLAATEEWPLPLVHWRWLLGHLCWLQTREQWTVVDDWSVDAGRGELLGCWPELPEGALDGELAG